ncbi:MAG TPA: NmrA/HSCARG family protein [Chitinophagaceae bacterium]
MNTKPMILVTGATGAQGGSVVRALLKGNKFKVRALTRNAGSEKAVALKNAGVEVVEGDLEDTASLMNAMNGCYAVFGLTSFWEHFDKEFRQGKNLVDAVYRSGITHFVFHTLQDYNKLSNGEFEVPHYDMKAALQGYTKALKIPATFIHTAFYYENFFSLFPLKMTEEGDFYFGFPQGNTRLAMTSSEDVGGVVATILDHPSEYIGRTVGVVGSDETCSDYAAMMSRILGRRIRYTYIPREVYANLGFRAAEEIANMFEVQRLYIPNRHLDLIESYGLNPAMQTFESWLKKNRKKFDAFFESLSVPSGQPV